MSKKIHLIRTTRRYTKVIVAILYIITIITPCTNVFAATNILYVAPNQSQMNIGDQLCVDITSYVGTISSGTDITTTGTLTYNSNLLQFVQILANGKKCPGTNGNDNATSYYQGRSTTVHTGSIDFSASQSQADSGVRYVFAAKFKATAAGNASIDFSSGSLNGTQPTLQGGTFTIINPTPSSTPQPSKKPSSSPKPVSSTPKTTQPSTTTPPNATSPQTTTSTTIPQTTVDPTGLIDSVTATPSYTSSTVTWRVDATNPTSSINYGVSYDQLDKKASVKKGAGGTFTATLSNLSPGIYYYFTITANGKHVSTGNYSSSFVTSGYPVVLTITENHIPIQSAQVKIGEQSLTANSSTLTVGLAAGSYSGTITTDTATLNINLTVKEEPIPTDGTPPKSQSRSFDLTSAAIDGGPGSNFAIFAFIGALAGGTILLAFGFVVFMNYRKRKFDSETYSTSPTSTVVIEDGYNWHQNADLPLPDVEPVPPMPTLVPPNIETPRHANSVYLTEEEPPDMFEQIQTPSPEPINPTSPSTNEMPQNPNSPHSTTP